MTEFLQLADILDNISAESGRYAKIALVGNFLRSLEKSEMKPAALFLAGRAFSESKEEPLNLSWKGLLNALKQAYEFKDEELWGNYEGDTGEAIAALLERGTLFQQTSLFSTQLTISGVYDSILKISRLKYNIGF